MEEKKSYYAVIPANVRYEKAKLLYGEITALCNEKGYCWANNEYFANLYGVSKTTISLLIKNLIDNGYIYSEIIYKEGTKEILNRYLKIIKYPIKEKLNTPIKENLKDNNTNNNNTINNTINKEKKNENYQNDICDYQKQFQEFYSLYPKKVTKKETEEWFLKKKLSNELFEIIIEQLKKQKDIWNKEKKDKKYILDPIRWLKRER